MLYDLVNLSLPKEVLVNMEMHLSAICLYCYEGKGPSIVYTDILSNVVAKIVPKGSLVSESFILCILKITLHVQKWDLFLIEENHLIYAERMAELGNHYHATTNIITELEKNHQMEVKR